jgi:hypothetical protein
VFAGAIAASLSSCRTKDTKRHEYTLVIRLVSGRPIRRHPGEHPVPITPGACIRSRLPTTSSSTFCIVPSWLHIGASAPNSGFIDCHYSRPSPVGDLGKLYGALAVTTVPVPRIYYLARRIHLLGERPLAELFIELAAGDDLHGVLERYGRLAPAADFIRRSVATDCWLRARLTGTGNEPYRHDYCGRGPSGATHPVRRRRSAAAPPCAHGCRLGACPRRSASRLEACITTRPSRVFQKAIASQKFF